MKFSKDYTKLDHPIFTTIRQNRGYYKNGQRIKITTPTKQFFAEIVSIRNLKLYDITENIARADADCTKESLIKLMKFYYKDYANDLIIIIT